MSKGTGFFRSAAPAILIGEDDPDLSDAVKEILEGEGFYVDTAFSGETTYSKMQDHVYELIILDVCMPGLSGEDVLKAHRERLSASRVPVIVMSAFAAAEDLMRYKNIGADASIAKPFDIDELLGIVRRLKSAAVK